MTEYSERYWEARWRDEKANNDALIAILQKVEPFLSYGNNAEGRLKQLIQSALSRERT